MDKSNDILMDGIDERIEAFLRGQMNEEEEMAFKQEISKNPELRNHALAMTSLIKGLQNQNAAREDTIIKENTTKLKVRPILWWACSIAAVFAIFFGAYKDHRYRILEATVSPYYAEYDIDEISRGDVDTAMVVHLYELFNQIQEKRSVSQVIKELESIHNSLDDDFTYQPWANDIAWNLALAYVKDDNIEKAISILQKLKDDNPDVPISIKADVLMKKLKDIQ